MLYARICNLQFQIIIYSIYMTEFKILIHHLFILWVRINWELDILCITATTGGKTFLSLQDRTRFIPLILLVMVILTNQILVTLTPTPFIHLRPGVLSWTTFVLMLSKVKHSLYATLLEVSSFSKFRIACASY